MFAKSLETSQLRSIKITSYKISKPDKFIRILYIYYKFIVQAGADPDIRAYDGCSALRFATLEGHREVVNALVDAMADVDSLDNDGRSILYACVLDQNLNMAKVSYNRTHNILAKFRSLIFV